VRTAYLEGRFIAALARDHDVSRGAIRTAVADLLPKYTAADPGAPAPELPVVLDMPGKVANFLRTADLQPAEHATLDQGVTVRRGQDYTLRGIQCGALLPCDKIEAAALMGGSKPSRTSTRRIASVQSPPAHIESR
jgi:hypothetical protein